MYLKEPRLLTKGGEPGFFCIKNREKRLLLPEIFQELVLVGTHLSEALAAENRPVSLGLEGNSCLTAATSAGSSEVLTGTTGVVLASIAASLAALGLILEAALCVELLLTSGEHELLATLFAN